MKTKQRILDSAKEIMLEKGLGDSTISEIASKAGVADSVIYHYFKNKEDLLFSFVSEHVQQILKELNEQLEGILEPVSRLSKMIWFHLRYIETHKDYTRLLHYECQSNRDYYEHESFLLRKQYHDVMLSILQDGCRVFVFRDDVNMQLVRDIIIGALDWETVLYALPHGLTHTHADFEELMKLIGRMIEIRPFESSLDTHKSTRILRTAEKIFSEKGYDKSTIGEIARLAEVAEGTVYEYFRNKEDLLLSIPKARLTEQMDSLKQLFEIKDSLRKLRRFIRYHVFLYMREPEFSKVFMLNVLLNPSFHGSEAEAIFEQYT
jgi:TetR/AcrR family fatty acid metabolism transcriptional regulator